MAEIITTTDPGGMILLQSNIYVSSGKTAYVAFSVFFVGDLQSAVDRRKATVLFDRYGIVARR